MQANSHSSIREKIKRRTLKSVDWWFAYTELSAEVVSTMGYPPERITVVENTINTDAFEQAIGAVALDQIERVRDIMDLNNGPVALYCGAMYADKQLPFLLEVAERLRTHIPGFNLVLIGSGPDQGIVEKSAERNKWIHYLGALYGTERAVYFASCDVLLMPGPVVLVIVDSFIAGLPLITTDIPSHGPEIAFLDNGVNGVITPYSVDDFVTAVADILSDKGQIAKFHEGFSESATRYSLGSMGGNFSAGIMACLGD